MRVVPARDAAGCAFAGPGVDLPPADVDAAVRAAAPLLAWLDALEPGVRLRSLSLDCARPRLLATITPLSAEDRPRAVRVDGAAAEEALVRAAPLLAWLAERAAIQLARRVT